MEEVKIFAPATVANLSCGFDVLGCCLEAVGDEMLIRKNNLGKLRITKITGQNLPLEVRKNVAGVAVSALLNKHGSRQGFDIEIYKRIKPGSGIGSSAASAAGAVFGINKLLGQPFSREELIPFAMEGERCASGNAHADNVAPALMGGMSLIRSYNPLEVLKLPVPDQLHMIILHPLIELHTRDSRSILKKTLSLEKAVCQWGNLAAFVSALYQKDYELLGRSLNDVIVEPVRSILIPYFDQLREVAMNKDALGFGISGSGPSVFALCKGHEKANEVGDALNEFYGEKHIEFDLHRSGISVEGIKIQS